MYILTDVTQTKTLIEFTLRAERYAKGKQQKIDVFVDDNLLYTLGGKRAERAEAVIVTFWHQQDGTPRIAAEVRGDIFKAQAEAARKWADTRKHRGYEYKVDPEVSYAVRVVDREAN